MNLVRQTTEKKILKWLKFHPSTSLMFHHRWPTSTQNVQNACHPFSTKEFFDTQYILIHNGVISNDDELKKAHTKLGIDYYSQQENGAYNDSEALLWDVALYLEGKQDKLNAHGSIAFICMAIPKDGRKHTKLYFGRNYGSPLHMKYTDKQLFLSSEGEGDNIDVNKLYAYDYRTDKMVTNELTIPSYVYHSTQPYSTGYWDDDEDRLDNVQLWSAYQEISDREYFYLLPEKKTYKWQDVIWSKPEKDTVVLVEGEEVPVLTTIKRYTESYLEEVDGSYSKAFNACLSDLEIYERMLVDDEDELNGEELFFEIDVLTAVLHTLYSCAGWMNASSKFWKFDTAWNKQFEAYNAKNVAALEAGM